MTRYKTPETLPEGYEREILIILAEEAGEVIQRITKMLRFGVHECQPGQKKTNKDRLSDEVGDLLEMIHKCKDLGLIDPERVSQHQLVKRAKLERYLQSGGNGDALQP